MEQQNFSSSDSQNLDRLLGQNAPDALIKTEDIKDDDILFFSQFGTLPNPGDNNDFNLIPHLDDGSTIIQTLGDVKNEPETSHYIKFKNQDGKPVKIWECGICGKEFGHQYTLMRHLPTHTDERKFHCSTCGKAFRQMSTLSQHRAIHSSERPYICEICQKTFNRVSTLISHRKTHTGLKPHRCHLCNKAFHQKGNLRNHVFTHTNERPYKCDVCEKGFNQMSNLMCHKLKAHQQSDIPKYVCKICGKEFLKRMGLRNHEQYQHGVNTQGVNPFAVEKHDFANAIVVEPIKTEAMRLAIESNETPFALLRPLSGIPVLVRVLPAGDKQLLVPATAEDLKKYGHISVTPKTAEGQEEDENDNASKPLGSVVQIKVPVVATVIQQCGQGGKFSMSVVSPGPNGEVVNDAVMENSHTDSYVYSSTLTDITNDSVISGMQEMDFTESIINGAHLDHQNIEFLDSNGKVLNVDDFQQHQNDILIQPNDYMYSDTCNLSTASTSSPVEVNLGEDGKKELTTTDSALDLFSPTETIDLTNDSSSILPDSDIIGHDIPFIML